MDAKRPGLPHGRQQRLLGRPPQKLEHPIRRRGRVFAFRFHVLEEGGAFRAQVRNQLPDPLQLEPRRPLQQHRPMRRRLRLLSSVEQPTMHGDFFAVDDDLQALGLGPDLGRPLRVGRRHRVAVRLELDEGRLRDHRRNDPHRRRFESWELQQPLFPQRLQWRSSRRPMDPGVSLPVPGLDPGVELGQRRYRPQRLSQIPVQAFHPPLLIGPARRTGPHLEPVMPGEVHKPRIEPDLRRPAEHNAFQIVVPMPMSDPLDLPEGRRCPSRKNSIVIRG